MIKNVVFDLGNVLVEFNPVEYLDTFGLDEELKNKLYDIIFSERWNRYDRGDYPKIADLRAALCKKYPKYGNEFFRILQPSWVKIHRVKTETAEYLYELKRRGYKVFILSNLSSDSYEYLKDFEFIKCIDGGVFSYQERSCKPEEKIYRVLLERYKLNADETVFLDDKPENIKVAESLGINGIVFTDITKAKEQLEEMLNRN